VGCCAKWWRLVDQGLLQHSLPVTLLLTMLLLLLLLLLLGAAV
jgi:hypothetical protein